MSMKCNRKKEKGGKEVRRGRRASHSCEINSKSEIMLDYRLKRSYSRKRWSPWIKERWASSFRGKALWVGGQCGVNFDMPICSNGWRVGGEHRIINTKQIARQIRLGQHWPWSASFSSGHMTRHHESPTVLSVTWSAITRLPSPPP